MTTGRGRDDTAAPRRIVQRRDLVERAAHLERARRLESLDLEVDVGPEIRRQEWRTLEGGAREVSVDDPARSDQIRDGRLPLHGATILRRVDADLGRGAGRRRGAPSRGRDRDRGTRCRRASRAYAWRHEGDAVRASGYGDVARRGASLSRLDRAAREG